MTDRLLKQQDLEQLEAARAEPETESELVDQDPCGGLSHRLVPYDSRHLLVVWGGRSCGSGEEWLRHTGRVPDGLDLG